MSPPLLELRQVDVFYGPVQALFSMSLTVQAGEIVVVLGGNASGKSTTVKTVLGLVAPRKGEVLLDIQPPRKSDKPKAETTSA